MRESVGVRKCGGDLLTHSKYALDLAVFVNSKVETDDRHRVERREQFELLELLLFFGR
jgi:hypothetical protein